MRKVTGLGTKTPGFLGLEGCREGTPEQTGQLQDVVRDRVDLKPPSILGSNSCGFLASKRLVTHAASFRLAAFEKQPGQRYWQRRLPCRLGLGKGAQRIPETQVSFCLNFSQAIKAGRESVWCWSFRRGTLEHPCVPTHIGRQSPRFRCPTPTVSLRKAQPPPPAHSLRVLPLLPQRTLLQPFQLY